MIQNLAPVLTNADMAMLNPFRSRFCIIKLWYIEKLQALMKLEKLFLENPNKMLQEWADEWGVTHERVRQLRIESGVPQRGAYNEETAQAILEIIRTGRGGLTTPRTYEEQPIGLERFKTWIEEEEGLAKE